MFAFKETSFETNKRAFNETSLLTNKREFIETSPLIKTREFMETSPCCTVRPLTNKLAFNERSDIIYNLPLIVASSVKYNLDLKTVSPSTPSC